MDESERAPAAQKGSGNAVKGAYMPVEIFAVGENTTACPLTERHGTPFPQGKGAAAPFPAPRRGRVRAEPGNKALLIVQYSFKDLENLL